MTQRHKKVKDRKALLLDLARRGKPKPHRRESMGTALFHYTHASQPSYDPAFDRRIRRLAPRWFGLTTKQRKELLLDRARRGKPKPLRKEPLGLALYRYTRATGPLYDRDFDRRIRRLAPRWFALPPVPAKEKKRQLLDMARRGSPRPHRRKPLGTALFRYTNANLTSYDPKFDRQIRKLALRWLVKPAVERKKQLLDMARRGEPRPGGGRLRLGEALSRYTSAFDSFDREFNQQIRKLAPQWFRRRR